MNEGRTRQINSQTQQNNGGVFQPVLHAQYPDGATTPQPARIFSGPFIGDAAPPALTRPAHPHHGAGYGSPGPTMPQHHMRAFYRDEPNVAQGYGAFMAAPQNMTGYGGATHAAMAPQTPAAQRGYDQIGQLPSMSYPRLQNYNDAAASNTHSIQGQLGPWGNGVSLPTNPAHLQPADNNGVMSLNAMYPQQQMPQGEVPPQQRQPTPPLWDEYLGLLNMDGLLPDVFDGVQHPPAAIADAAMADPPNPFGELPFRGEVPIPAALPAPEPQPAPGPALAAVPHPELRDRRAAAASKPKVSKAKNRNRKKTREIDWSKGKHKGQEDFGGPSKGAAVPGGPTVAQVQEAQKAKKSMTRSGRFVNSDCEVMAKKIGHREKLL